MPYLEPSTATLPYQSGSETSRAGAIDARGRSSRQRETLRLLYQRYRHGLTDAEMSEISRLPVTTICARRNELKCVPSGRRMGRYNVSVTVWRLPEDAA